MIKNCFPDAKQIKQCHEKHLCKECKYVQKERNESEGNIDSSPDIEHTFLSSYFHEKPIVDVETIEERFKRNELS